MDPKEKLYENFTFNNRSNNITYLETKINETN